MFCHVSEMLLVSKLSSHGGMVKEVYWTILTKMLYNGGINRWIRYRAAKVCTYSFRKRF